MNLDRRVVAALLILSPMTPVPAHAGTLEGEVWVEMEYLGESFFSEQRFTADDLGIPGDSPSLVFTDTTRFADAIWLPGQRLNLAWGTNPGSAHTVRAQSRTAYNSERFFQELRLSGFHPTGGGSSLEWRVDGAFREESRSVVGRGDWGVRSELRREQRLGSLRSVIRVGWDHSRSRADTTTYLFDYDLARLRATLSGGGGWLSSWELYAEGGFKSVPLGAPGSYEELRAGGAWRPASDGSRSLVLDVRARNYREDGTVGRDFGSAQLEFRSRTVGWTRSAVHLELLAWLTDYAGSDALYFDSAEMALYLPWRLSQSLWTLAAGPAVRWLGDLDAGARDYRQWSLRSSLGRVMDSGGFGELTVEAGLRDYRAEVSEVVEVSTLSSAFLRSDYWLFEVLGILNIPVGSGFALDVLGSSSWEFHRNEAERIQVTFFTLGVSRRF